MQKLAFV